MAHKQAALKHIRQTKIRMARNRSEKDALKSLLKKTSLAAERTSQDAEQTVRLALKKIDKAAQHGILKKNAAARKKSRLMRKVNALRAAKS